MAEDLVGLGKAIGPLTEVIAELVRKMFEPAAGEIGELLSAYVKRRNANAERTVHGAAQILYERKIEPKPVALKMVFPILEGCSLEDEDENLTSKWAGLLASVAAGDQVHTSYPRILAELTPADAKIMDAVYQRLIESTSDEKDLLTIEELREKVDVSPQEFEIAVFNLRRLDLCDVPAFTFGDPIYYIDSSCETYHSFKVRLSSLGCGLVKACHGPLPSY